MLAIDNLEKGPSAQASPAQVVSDDIEAQLAKEDNVAMKSGARQQGRQLRTCVASADVQWLLV